jgi:hypothetical protein
MTRALTEDSIICDIPRNDATRQLDLSHSSNQLYQLFYYITHNFSHFASLAFIRLRYFFLMVRSYFSTFHNFFLLAYLIVLYGSALMGIKRIIKLLPVSLTVFLFTTIMLFAFTIALQCDDYHNRFALTLMPFYVIMAMWTWEPLMNRISFLKPHKDLPYPRKNISS